MLSRLAGRSHGQSKHDTALDNANHASIYLDPCESASCTCGEYGPADIQATPHSRLAQIFGAEVCLRGTRVSHAQPHTAKSFPHHRPNHTATTHGPREQLARARLHAQLSTIVAAKGLAPSPMSQRPSNLAKHAKPPMHSNQFDPNARRQRPQYLRFQGHA
eukprot:6489877-Amphidinium_carterae.1